MERGWTMNEQDAARCVGASSCEACLDADTWAFLADMYAFAGNSLLVPMSQSSEIGLDPRFWAELPCFGDDRLEKALMQLRSFAEEASAAEATDRRASAAEATGERASGAEMADGRASGAEDAVRAISVEFTHLFMGPPSPACPPWETYYREAGTKNGFGRATFEMREILRGLGLRASGPGNQFEDHAGLELLVLSEMCRRAAESLDVPRDLVELASAEPTEPLRGVEGASSGVVCAFSLSHQEAASFVNGRLAAWIPAFAASVASERPGGYHALLLAYVSELLAWHGRALNPTA